MSGRLAITYCCDGDPGKAVETSGKRLGHEINTEGAQGRCFKPHDGKIWYEKNNLSHVCQEWRQHHGGIQQRSLQSQTKTGFTCSELEEAIMWWIINAWEAYLPVNGTLICAQASKMNIEEFKAWEIGLLISEAVTIWLLGVCVWQKSFRGWKHDKGVVGHRVREHLVAYDAWNIFDGDETVLFFKAFLIKQQNVTFKCGPAHRVKESKKELLCYLVPTWREQNICCC